MSKDRARLLDILDWARAAMKEAAGRTRADFDTDENFFLAQVKRVEVVGEAASRLTPDTCRLMPEVPWAAVSATRNRLVHAYHEMSRDIVWTAIEIEFPKLVESVERFLRGGRWQALPDC